jgi:4-amino-4-deoxy-L-arabinose transferase-like glycosyltransferase
MQTRALVDFGETSLNRAMRVYGPIGDLSVVDGRYYPSKAPLLSFAAVPVYWLLRSSVGGRIGAAPEIPLVYFSRLFLTVLPTLLSLILVRRFLVEYVDARIADVVTITYALGTLAYSYSLLFMSHQTTASLLFAAFFCIWSAKKASNPAWRLVLAGALAALAVAAEYTSALCATLLVVYLCLGDGRRAGARPIAILSFVVGALPVLALLMAYHAITFGGPFETGYRHLADAAYQPWHVGGFLGIRTPRADVLLLSLFSPLRGLLALSPVLILGFIGVRDIWTRRGEKQDFRELGIFTILLVVSYLYFTASFSYESWGWTTGPRHLTGLVPFLLLPVALVLARGRRTLHRGVAAGLVLSSIVITAALTAVNYIPDDVSDGRFGLSFPLFAGGELGPSILNPLGLTNPIAGLAVLVLVATAGAVVCSALIGRDPGAARRLGVSALILLLCVTAHRIAYRDSANDRAALALLRHDWLAPPGARWS